MPGIVFIELIQALMGNQSVFESIELLIKRKALEFERSTLEVPPHIYDFVSSEYADLEEEIEFSQKPDSISNHDFQNFLSSLDS